MKDTDEKNSTTFSDSKRLLRVTDASFVYEAAIKTLNP